MGRRLSENSYPREICRKRSGRRTDSQRWKFRRLAPIARRLEDGNVGQLFAGLNTTQHEATAAHVSAANEFGGERKAFSKDRKQRIHVFRGCDAAQKHDLTIGTRRFREGT